MNETCFLYCIAMQMRCQTHTVNEMNVNNFYVPIMCCLQLRAEGKIRLRLSAVILNPLSGKVCNIHLSTMECSAGIICILVAALALQQHPPPAGQLITAQSTQTPSHNPQSQV